MPNKPRRFDPPAPRDANADHWGLFGLIAGVRRSLEEKAQYPTDLPRPHGPMRATEPTAMEKSQSER